MRPLELERDKWVLMSEAPDRIGCDKSTIYRWVKAGKVRTFRPLRELWLYLPDLLDAEAGKLGNSS